MKLKNAKTWLFVALATLPLSACADDGSGLGLFSSPVVISEVVFNSSGDQIIEITNLSDDDVDITGWQLCVQLNYWGFPSFTLGAGERVSIHWDASGADTATDLFTGTSVPSLANDSDSVGLYENADDFADAENILDYVQWGAGGQDRENVAASAGIWSAGTFVDISEVVQDESISFTGSSGAQNGPGFWCRTDATVGAANGTCKSPPMMPAAPRDPVLISEVIYDPGSGDQLIEILNTSASAVDLGSYWLCVQLMYWNFPSTMLAAGGRITVHWDATGTDTASELFTGTSLPTLAETESIGLYSTNNFGSSNAIEDYLQWGAGGEDRESVANSAGIWTAGQFIDVSSLNSGESLSFTGLDTDDNGPANWCRTNPTFGSANGSCL